MDRASRMEQVFNEKKTNNYKQSTNNTGGRNFAALNEIAMRQNHAKKERDAEKALERTYNYKRKPNISVHKTDDDIFKFNSRSVNIDIDNGEKFPTLGGKAAKVSSVWGNKSKTELMSKLEEMKEAPVKKAVTYSTTAKLSKTENKIHIIENYEEIYNDILHNPKLKSSAQQRKKSDDGFVTIVGKDTHHRNYY